MPPRELPVLRKISWRMSGRERGLLGSVIQERRHVCRARKAAWSAVCKDPA